MRVPLTVLVLVAFIAPAFGQDAKRIAAENVRSFERIVKGAPFSAEATSESVQTLSDGNRITRRTTSRLYRDNEGRFRREDMPKQLGVAGSVVDIPESIVITDPVSGTKYTLNPKNQTFRQSSFNERFDFKLENEHFKLKAEEFTLKDEAAKQAQEIAREKTQEAAREMEKGVIAPNDQVARKQARAIREAQAETRKQQMAERKAEVKKVIKGGVETDAWTIKPPSDPNSKTESLGTQTIEGIQAEGTRTTTTVPANSIGNELPIEVVYERWYSPELQLIVQSTHTDPRFGVQTYRLTNVRRDEPPMSLFSPPGDYKPASERWIKPIPIAPPKPPTDKKAVPAKPVTPVAPKKTISSDRSDREHLCHKTPTGSV